MNLNRRTMIGAGIGAGAALGLTASAARAQWGDPPSSAAGDPLAPAWPPHEHYPIWPGPPPGAPATLPAASWTMNGPATSRELWIRGVPTPEIAVYRPARPNGVGLLTLPGGGYDFLSVQNEGIDVAQHFTGVGVTVFVLTYRLPAEGWADRTTVPLQDAQRAMRLIRSRAAEFRIDSAKLGVVGFSAGGHLAADLATRHGESVYRPADGVDALPARPAFAGLVYPVTSLQPAYMHGGSLERLLGSNPSTAAVAARSPLLHVDPQTPSCFLMHAVDDPIVPLGNSLDWILACQKNKVPVEAHIVQEGGHGFGLHLDTALPGSRWPALFDLWIQRQIARA